MININIYSDYILKCEGKYSYINEYGDFSEGKIDYERELSGSKLIDLIIDSLHDIGFGSVSFKTNKIEFDEFDPLSGETSTYCFIIKENNSHK